MEFKKTNIMKTYQIIAFIFIWVIFFLISLSFDITEATLMQALYVTFLLFILLTVPIFFIISNSFFVKLKYILNVPYISIKVCVVVLYVLMALVFDFFKTDIFHDNIQYISSFLYYANMIIAALYILFHRNKKIVTTVEH